jgi:ABC-2 type transport system ATP-binding protein
MDEVLEIRGVEHRYGGAAALAGIDLSVGRGECVALLGPNGAGKSTVIGLATGLLAAQTGQVRVAGGDPRVAATRRRLGVMQQATGFPRTLTVAEIVRGAAVRAGRPGTTAMPVLAEAGVADLARRRVAKLSGGQKQRVALAMALVGNPGLLLLDEPTVGLDVTGRRAFWRTVAARRDAGTAVLLTTHGVEEAAAVADRVVVLDGGRVVATGSPDELTALLPDRTVTARTAVPAETLRVFPGVAGVTVDGSRVRVATSAPEDLLRHWLAVDAGLADLRVEGAGLEEALVSLTIGVAA